MKRIITFVFFALTMVNVQAKDADNSKMVSLYKNQLEQTKQLTYETQQVLQASYAIVELSKKINSASGLEIKAINRHFVFLDETSTEIYGNSVITPFESCKRLPMKASFVFQENIDNLRRDNSHNVKNFTDDYISTLKACSDEINTPPPKIIKESDQLQIIDVN